MLCFRYSGRRINTINPAQADIGVCSSYTEPVEEPGVDIIESDVPCTLQNLWEDLIPLSRTKGVPTIVLSQEKPNMRYGVKGMLLYFDVDTVALSSNSITAALEKLRRNMPGGDNLPICHLLNIQQGHLTRMSLGPPLRNFLQWVRTMDALMII